MQIIRPSYEIMTPINGVEILKFLEKVGRTCYKSEEKITEDSLGLTDKPDTIRETYSVDPGEPD